MYTPTPFAITDQTEIHAFIQANAFGQIISSHNGRLFSTHMPFLFDEERATLSGHFAKQNPQHVDIEDQEVLVTLEGPHDYISPSWYEIPGVPTWNYQTVHIYGVCKRIDDPVAISKIIHALTDKYEAISESPWIPDYNPAMIGGIVGVEISIIEIQCKFKLSQNRPLQDRTQVVAQLEQRGSLPLANAMRKKL